MSEISKVAGLSKLYTNHSGRATTVHVLDEADAPSRHIMSVTGHKSETSLKAYSGKTCEKNMSELISEKTTGKLAKVDLLCLSQSTSTNTVATSIQDENMPLDTDLDYELLSASQSDMVLNDIQLPDDHGLDDILKSIEVPNNNSNLVKPTTAGNCAIPMTHVMMPTNSGNYPMSVLNNFQNITVNVNYNVFSKECNEKIDCFNVKMIKLLFELHIC